MTTTTVLGAEQVIHDQSKAKGMVYEKASRHQILQKRITGSARIPVRAGTVDDGVEYFGRQLLLAAPSRRDLDAMLPRYGAHNRRGARGQSPRLDQRIDFRFSLWRKPEPVRFIPWRQMT
jgi:hypothetical protein